MGFWSGFFGGVNYSNLSRSDKGLRQKIGARAQKSANEGEQAGALRQGTIEAVSSAVAKHVAEKTALAKNEAQQFYHEGYYFGDGPQFESHAHGDGTHETTALHNAGFTLAFMHVPTGREVEFKAFLDQISDAYTTNWSTESVYGRMDQIATFQNTQRAIAVSWIVPAGSELEAIDNMRRVQHLMQFMYPVYTDDSVLASAPLLRLKFGNLIRDAKTGKGLLGYVNGFTVDPDQEAGWFAYSHGPMTGDPELYPKALRLNCDFTVLHEHDLGYKQTAEGYVFGRSAKEIATNPDVNGIDFPFPAGAGDPIIESNEDIIRLSRNSHYSDEVGPVVPGQEAERNYKESILREGGSVSAALRNDRYELVLSGDDWSKGKYGK
jgi:hypothetical protein